MAAVNCPVHGPGYGRCLGCLLEALYGIRHLENPYDGTRRKPAAVRPAGPPREVVSPSKSRRPIYPLNRVTMVVGSQPTTEGEPHGLD